MEHRVELGEYLDFLRSLDTESVALVEGDPPFGICYQNNYTKKKHRRIVGDEKSFSYGPLADEAMRILKPDGVIILYTGWSTYPTHFQELDRAGFQMREPYRSGRCGCGSYVWFGSCRRGVYPIGPDFCGM